MKKFTEYTNPPQEIIKEDVLDPSLSQTVISKKSSVDLIESFGRNYSAFTENIQKAETLLEEIKTLSENTDDLIRRDEVEQILATHLLLVNESIQQIKSDLQGINEEDMQSIQEIVDGLVGKTDSLIEYIDLELPKVKRLVFESEIKSDKNYSKLESEVSEFNEHIVSISEEIEEYKKEVAENFEVISENKQIVEEHIAELYENVKSVNDNLGSLTERYETTVTPALVKLNEFDTKLDNAIDEQNHNLVKAKEEIKQVINEVNTIFINAKYIELDRKVERIEEIFTKLDSKVLTEEVKEETKPASDLDRYLTDKSFQQPNPPAVSADFSAVTAKLKFLEQAIGRIAATGPGGGEVNLRWLDDVDRSTIGNNKYLRYNSTKKKFEFATVEGGGGGVQADWTMTDSEDPSFILNKPTLFSGSYTDLTNKPTIPAAQIQSDWNQSNNAALDFIKNKPSIPSLTGYATENYVNTTVSNLVNSAPTTLDTLKELATALGNDASFSTTITTALGTKIGLTNLSVTTASASGSGSLAYNNTNGVFTFTPPVLFSGSYNDLTNKPTIPAAQIQSDWNQTDNASLDYIKNKPSILTSESDTLDSVTDRGNTTTNSITVGDATANFFQLDTTPSPTPTVTTGMIAWNAQDNTFDMGLLNGVTLQAGQETHMYVKAYEAISNGQAVMFAGANGEHILVRKYDPTVAGFITEWFVGVATQDFTLNEFGYVTIYGKVHDLNTNAYTVGDILYVDNTTPGALTTTAPAPGKPHIIVAAVTKKSATGHIMVRPDSRPFLYDLPDVNITSPTNGQVLKYNATLGYWVNDADATGAGGSGIALTDLSVTVGSPSGNGNLSYNDGTGVFTFTPASVPAAQIQSDWTQTNNASLDYIKNKPTLATVATSGSYTDLSNKPSIPTVYDSTITIAAGTGMSGGGTFTLNQSGTTTVTLASTITQYTDSLARSAITLSTESATNGGSLSYNSSTGAFTFQPATTYTLPTATGSVLGGIKIGSGLSIDGSGVVTTTLQSGGNVTFNNITTTGQIVETFQTYSTSIGASQPITLDCTGGNILNITSTVTQNWTAAFTNLAITTGKATNTTLIINQGATAWIPTAVTVNGNSTTINWQGGASPTGSANKKDVIAFSILQTGASTFLVFGQLVSFG